MDFMLAFACLVLLCVLRSWLWRAKSSSPGKKEPDDGDRAHALRAELEGPRIQPDSVFAHINRGLEQAPDSPAVICTFPQDPLLQTLVASCTTGFKKPPTSGTRADAADDGVHSAGKGRKVNGVHRHGDTASPAVEPEASHFTMSYRQLHQTSLALALGLLARGARPNTTMLMLIPNGGEYALLLWTCILLRVAYACLDPAMLDVTGFTELKNTLQRVRPQIVVVPDRHSGRAVEVAVSELQLPEPIYVSACPGQRGGDATGRPPLPARKEWMSLLDVARGGGERDGDAAAAAAQLVAAALLDDPDRIHSVLFTSGTSGGAPKGCPLRAGGMAFVLQSQAWLVDGACGARALQQAHNARGIAPAQTLQTWRAGGAVVMTGRGGFDTAAAAAAIGGLGVTFVVLTPPMVHEMAAELGARPRRVGSVRRVQLGGDAVTRDLVLRCAALFPDARVCVNHGMTEGGGAFVWPFFQTPARGIPFFQGQLCPVGTVASGARVRIWDAEEGRVVDRGELGELHVSSGSLIKHYLAGRSSGSFYEDSAGRWFATGDVATVDRDGVVYVLGRKRDVIRRAGRSIVPAAIESCIERFAGVQVSMIRLFSATALWGTRH